jgi:hypothetical protein
MRLVKDFAKEDQVCFVKRIATKKIGYLTVCYLQDKYGLVS